MPAPLSAFPTALQYLLQGDAYPHPVRAVELIETHISWVLLTGEFAYKIKRPVQFAFIDLRSFERRAFLCEEEVRLNRRFAPELYLSVCPISLVAGRARIGADGAVVEHAVRMRQFAREEELDRLLAANRIEPVELATFAGELARIHEQLPRPGPDQQWGRPEVLRNVVLENAVQCARAAQALGESFPSLLHTQLAARLDAAMPLLLERFTAGRVRECHGDLHARNVVRLGGALRAFDCLEFEPALRWTDVADEIAFLIADLEVRARALHAHAFLSGYLAHSGDYRACELLPLFKASRALVRAKVAALSAMAPAARAAGSEARREVGGYLSYAQRALGNRSGVLVLTCGLSGSGKTWIARRLAPQLSALHLRSDVERKRLAGLDALERGPAALAQGLYGAQASARTYAQLAEDAGAVLAGGSSVIVDATFGTRAQRAQFRALAAQHGARLGILYCHAPRPVLAARLRERQRRADDPSDAGPAVLAWQQPRFEPIATEEASEVFDVPTAEPETTLASLLQRIAAQLTVSAL